MIQAAPKALRPPVMLNQVDFSIFQKSKKEKSLLYNHKKKVKAEERRKLEKGESIKMKRIAWGQF